MWGGRDRERHGEDSDLADFSLFIVGGFKIFFGRFINWSLDDPQQGTR